MTSRVSNLTLSQSAIHSLQANLAKMSELQSQASTGKKLQKPSDSPVGIGSSLQLRAQLSRNTQLTTNINDAEGWLGTADAALGSVTERLQQVHTLMLQAANASTDQVGRDAIANQIDQIRQGLIGFANTQYGNRPVFGGTTSGPTAYDTGGNYVGRSAPIERTIAPGVKVQVNVNGDTVFGPAGNDVFTTLTQISAAVHAGAPLDTLSAQLKTQTQQVLTQRGQIGAVYARVETVRSQNSKNATSMEQGLSQVEDVDLAEILMNLAAQQTTYQAALAAAARAIQPSLANFLQ